MQIGRFNRIQRRIQTGRSVLPWYRWNNNANAWVTIQTAFPAYHSCMIRAVEGPRDRRQQPHQVLRRPQRGRLYRPIYSNSDRRQLSCQGRRTSAITGMIRSPPSRCLSLTRLYDQTFTSINLSSNGNAQFMTTDTTFTNQCLPWTTHNYTIYPYWDDLYLVNSRVRHIHIDKWHCSQPHLQH